MRYIVSGAMRRFAGICLFTIAFSFAALGQLGTVPTKWTGTWELNVRESTFGAILVPGAPSNLKIVAQSLKIQQTGKEIILLGDSVVSGSSGQRTSHDDFRLSLDGTPTNVGPVSLSFRRIDNSAFEIISTVNLPNTNVGEVSRYVFSSDGSKLTATKIQTERAPAPISTDKSKGAVIRQSKFILLYDKLSEHD